MKPRMSRAKYIAIELVAIAMSFGNPQALCLADDATNSAALTADKLNGGSLRGRPHGKKDAVNSQQSLDTQELVVAAKKNSIIRVDTGKQTAAVIVIPEGLLQTDGPNAKLTKQSSGGFFGPVTRLQEEVARLEVELSKLIAPIDGLQPGMLGLEKQMSGVLQETVNLQEEMGGLQGKIGSTMDQMVSMQSDINALRLQLGTLIPPIQKLKDPVAQLRTPIVDIRKPVLSVDTRMAGLDTRFAGLDNRFVELDSRFAKLDSRFTKLDSRFATLDTRFATLDTRFATLDTRFAALDTRLVTLGNQLQSLQVLLSVLLNSAVTGAVIIALWILVAAVLNRRRTSNVLSAAHPLDAKEEPLKRNGQRSRQA